MELALQVMADNPKITFVMITSFLMIIFVLIIAALEEVTNKRRIKRRLDDYRDDHTLRKGKRND